MRCGEQVTNCHYFIQSSFTLHSLHLELPRKSQRFFGLFIVLSTIASVFNHRSCLRSTHLLLFHDALFIIRKASPEWRRPAYSFTVSLGKSQVEVCERRGKSFIKYFKGPFIKMLLRDTMAQWRHNGNTIYM